MKPKIKYYIKDLPANIYFESRWCKWYMYLYKLYLYLFKPKCKEGNILIPTTSKYVWNI